MFNKIITQTIRIILAGTFIFSGFVKLVDPIGSDIKMKEYLSPDVLNIPQLIPYTLLLSILLIIAELVLGIMLLVGFKRKLTLTGITILMIIFLFLTWYSAYYNKVTDCGCFGEAVKLSAWGTFYKNVVLIVFIVFLWWKSKLIQPFFSSKFALWSSFAGLIFGLFISYYVLQHLPIIDFTAYKKRVDIAKEMEIKQGEDLPEIHDFAFWNDDNDFTETILTADKVILIISYSLAESNLDNFSKIKTLTDKALKEGYVIYCLSASNMEDFYFIRDKYKLNFDMLWGDGTTLKTMIRANPGIMTLEKGVIIGKWNGNDVEKVKL
jgi:uncharacterized membrane protein YphA (DoxX/SURF4 family)